MRYLVVYSLQRGPMVPPEPVDSRTQAVLEAQDRYEESLRAHKIHWDNDWMKPKRRREVA